MGFEDDLINDAWVRRLAHPLRCDAANPGAFDLMLNYLGSQCWSNMERAFRSENTLTTVLLNRLNADPQNRPLQRMTQLSVRMDSGSELGNAFPTMYWLRHRAAPEPYFVIDDALVDMLEETDIADDVPVSMLTLPFPRFYLELGRERRCGAVLPNLTSGNHILEGAYFERGDHPVHGEVLNVMLTGSPIGKENSMDDATFLVYFKLRDKDKTIRDLMYEAHRAAVNATSSVSGIQSTPTEFIDPTLDCIMLLTKALLYIALPEARRQVRRDRTDWQKSLAAIKSTAKKAKAERRGRALVDHILIDAGPGGFKRAPQSDGTRTVKAHWRRGFLRCQRVGPQLSQQRMVLIRPTLVNSGSGDAPPREYKVV